MVASKRGHACGRHLSVAVLMAGIMGLSGCGGGGGGGGTVTATTIDESVLSANAGTDIDPYVLPTEMATGTNGGIEDYFARGGYWSVPDRDLKGWVLSGDAGFTHYYDADADIWIVDFEDAGFVSGSPATETHKFGWDAGAGRYVDSGGGTLSIYDADPATAQYGTFGIVNAPTALTGILIGAGNAIYYFHTGIGTPLANMPNAGSATYNGTFQGYYGTSMAGYYAANGEVTFGANFGTGEIALSMPTDGTIAGGGTFSLSGTGTVSGNVFSISTTATASTTSVTMTGAMTGSFYGPSADEIAGTLHAGAMGVSTDYYFIEGGMWAAQTSYTP